MPDLTGRRVLVTGASSGIGAATARACAAAGAAVAATARRREPLDALAAELGAVALPCDLTDPTAAQAMVAEAAARLGGLDAVVNNAGVMRPATIAEASVDDWRAMLEVNVLAILVVTQAALPHLRAATFADVVNMSSRSGRRVPNAAAGVYSATKFGVHALTEGLRQELAGTPVRATVIAPGLVATDLVVDDGSPAARDLSRATTELGLSPADVAAEIVHVLSRPAHVHLREIVLTPTAQDS